jgi:hypothetical protein
LRATRACETNPVPFPDTRPNPEAPPKKIAHYPGPGRAGGAQPKDPGFRSIIPMGDLAGLLAIGREFQSHTDWHKRRPPAA